MVCSLARLRAGAQEEVWPYPRALGPSGQSGDPPVVRWQGEKPQAPGHLGPTQSLLPGAHQQGAENAPKVN